MRSRRGARLLGRGLEPCVGIPRVQDVRDRVVEEREEDRERRHRRVREADGGGEHQLRPHHVVHGALGRRRLDGLAGRGRRAHLEAVGHEARDRLHEPEELGEWDAEARLQRQVDLKEDRGARERRAQVVEQRDRVVQRLGDALEQAARDRDAEEDPHELEDGEHLEGGRLRLRLARVAAEGGER